MNDRGFSNAVIDQFEVGYCPTRVEHEVSGRIITPIYDTYGELVSISTRHLDQNHSLRFWHESFDKGSYLYGLNNAKSKIIETRKVIIVEGEFDVIFMHKNGFTQTVGVCGSALTLSQISLLIRYCSEFYLMFDPDEAGREATRRALELHAEYDLGRYGISFIPVRLPIGYDPDDFIKKMGRRKMKEKLINSKEEVIF